MHAKTILAISPSGIFNPESLRQGVTLLESWGHTVLFSPNYDAQHMYTAGTLAQRLEDLLWAIEHPFGDCIWFVRGGYGTAQLLPHLDWPIGKPIIGFSDATALLTNGWNNNQSGMIHGPVLNSLATLCDAHSINTVMNYLNSGQLPTIHGTYLMGPKTTIHAPVVGGNLCVLASLCGTPYQLNADGCILALEDVGEAFYKLDRLLLQLELSGMFHKIQGILLGTFEGCNPPRDSSLNILDVFVERLGPLNIPVYHQGPFGHGSTNWMWEQGQIIKLSPKVNS